MPNTPRILFTSTLVECWRLERQFPRCERDVLPLDEHPMTWCCYIGYFSSICTSQCSSGSFRRVTGRMTGHSLGTVWSHASLPLYSTGALHVAQMVPGRISSISIPSGTLSGNASWGLAVPEGGPVSQWNSSAVNRAPNFSQIPRNDLRSPQNTPRRRFLDSSRYSTRSLQPSNAIIAVVLLEPAAGFEPATPALRKRCSAN